VNNGPVPANITSLLPDPFNADTWRLADPAFGAIATRYSVGVSDSSNFLTPVKMWKYGAWAQDDWRLTNKLTLNLGLRYDLIWNAFAQNVTFLPFELADRPQDANNIQPRLGFRLLADRSHRSARRRGAVLQRRVEHERAMADESADDRRDCRGQHAGSVRLRCQPVQRTAADL
jgi:hypothetical protein